MSVSASLDNSLTAEITSAETDWISDAADWELLASSPISVATTAKPLPASPARAASIEALRARRLVWFAIAIILPVRSSILPTALERSIFSETDPAISSTRSSVSDLSFLALSPVAIAEVLTSLENLRPPSISPTMPSNEVVISAIRSLISLRDADVSSMVALMSVIVSEIDSASPRAPRTLSAILDEEVLSLPESACMDKSIPRINSMRPLILLPITSNSSPDVISIFLVRSPSPAVSSTILSLRTASFFLSVTLSINRIAKPTTNTSTQTRMILRRRADVCSRTHSILISTPTTPTIELST